MKLEPQEIQALAQALAPLVADLLDARLSERPELAYSIGEAAAWAQLPEHVVRDAIADGRLPVVHVGRQIRIRRCDLLRVESDAPDGRAQA
jgi:excisionase family DNA binding protein